MVGLPTMYPNSAWARSEEGYSSSLTYQKIMGKGSYKTIYLVTDQFHKSYAMAVEKVRSKTEAKNALHGIRIAQELQERKWKLNHDTELYNCFEHILDWWFQSEAPVPEKLKPGSPMTIAKEQSQKIPRRFLGQKKWLVALKPLYDMDLRIFLDRAPLQYAIDKEESDKTKTAKPYRLAGLDLDRQDDTAFRIAIELCRAGTLMHNLGMVHRDIKLTNVMLSNGRPVIIDFGFAEFVPQTKGQRMCINEAGKLRGDPNYMLAADAAIYQGCEEGDRYAMGKTMYLLFFGETASASTSSSSTSSSSSSSASSSSSSSSYKKGKVSQVEKIQSHEQAFQRVLSDTPPSHSRFKLSSRGRNDLMTVIRGICEEAPDKQPMSFSEATDYLERKRGEHMSPQLDEKGAEILSRL
jgi:serine/threonine protein kinase